MHLPFSVLMSVYEKENPSYFRQSLESIFSGSVSPDEVVLVEDGKLTKELYDVVSEYSARYPVLKVVPMKENSGLGLALNAGLRRCSHSLIARMDSDDISLPVRFEKQLACFEADESLSLVGGQVEEFDRDPQNIIGKRSVPLTDSEIRRFMKHRSPFNHVSVMFKKEAVLKAGGYQDSYCTEDYYLWIRIMLAGCKFANLPDTLVNVRVESMSTHRGGMRYFRSIAWLTKYMYDNHVISLPSYMVNVFVRFVMHVLASNRLREIVYHRVLREKASAQ